MSSQEHKMFKLKSKLMRIAAYANLDANMEQLNMNCGTSVPCNMAKEAVEEAIEFIKETWIDKDE